MKRIVELFQCEDHPSKFKFGCGIVALTNMECTGHEADEATVGSGVWGTGINELVKNGAKTTS